MPFKAGKAPTDVNKRVKAELTQRTGTKLERALSSAMVALGNASDQYVPIDTYDLIQSRLINIIPTSNGFKATLGYYEDYAKYLYSDTSWLPRTAGSPGKRGSGVNSKAKPFWIQKGLAFEFTNFLDLLKSGLK